MNWLTQIRVSPKDAARKKLADTYAWHQGIWEAFPGRNQEKRDFLMRVDRKRGFYEILLLSDIKPQIPDWGSWQSKEIAPSFLEHERYMFQVRANPTIKRVIRQPDGTRKKNGARTAIYAPEELRAWFKRQADKGGFQFQDLAFSPPVKIPFRKPRSGQRGIHSSVDFRGVLRVIERDRFRECFCHGIGPARAFGFGLLMLQPVD